MVIIVGNWELSWNTPIKEAELWNLAMREFGVKDWYMFPVTGIRHNESPFINLHERHYLDDILEEVRDLGTLVFVEPAFPKAEPDHQWLHEFKHPENCVYIFGSAHYNPCHRKTEKDIALAVPTIDNKGALWPHQCMVTILYDRLVKSWQS